MARGRFGFELSKSGQLANTATNVEALRRLWLDRSLFSIDELGPGDPGDFDKGAWHSACHLTAAAGVLTTHTGLAWLQVEHDTQTDQYFAGVTIKHGEVSKTLWLDSADGRDVIRGATLLGFVEGNSRGRISAHNPNDPPSRFNLCRRQDYDQPLDSEEDGGRVWEHWCIQRDLRAESPVGTSILTAFISLASTLGDNFSAVVARGRRDYGHPVQLCAMVEGGLTSTTAAELDILPRQIPSEMESIFNSSNSTIARDACASLDWSNDHLSYYMFNRKLGEWVTRQEIQQVRTSWAQKLLGK